MIDDFVFLTEAQHFDEIKKYLRETHGLVKARPGLSAPCDVSLVDEQTLNSDVFLSRYLVWENENKEGKFRIMFQTENQDFGSNLFWRYYGNRIIDEITMLEDPMKRIGRATYEQFNGIFRVLLYTGKSVDPNNFFA